jgi:PhnB protein
MATVNVYLNFDGTCEAAFNLYKSVFDGEFTYLGRFGEIPSPDRPIPDAVKNQIMHMALPISGETMLMGSDSPESFGVPKLVPGNNYSIMVSVSSPEEAEKIYKGLSAGGKIIMPLEKTFWADLYGMWTDKFGINWMVDYTAPKE